MKSKNKEIDHYDNIVKSLKQLKKDYPTSNMGKHLEIAFSDYCSLFSVSDKELSYALDKYIAELDMNTVSDDDMEIVLRDTEILFSEIETEDEDFEEDFKDEEDF